MSVTLINKTRRMKVFTLSHETYCQALGQCACKPQPGRDKRLIPISLSLPAEQLTENLPEAVLQVPDIARAIKRGELEARKNAASANDRSRVAGKKKSGKVDSPPEEQL